MKLDERIQARLAALVEKGEKAVATHVPRSPFSFASRPSLDGEQFAEWRSQSLVCLTQVFGPAHDYTTSFVGDYQDNLTGG